ncbi:hypothetical protein AGR7C_pAt0123 [Agrobacterium deltaense Zutra 3/1]|uniref:Thiamine pyrophosphate enzyme N-terminal TPP-binding domain-containing protein n=1 Tax=Agrobacterium deltaense Zutra 3/1 TaxID=1183427 RepID=A0A1S7S452_9HYPH|nr:hypothetical protein AGR7C_pAt0123 [Agrobacterium deltaense Zutra 3/1]
MLSIAQRRVSECPAKAIWPFSNALHDTAGRLDYVLCRNEGGASFMAAAYGKLTGEPGICFVTRGPGATMRRSVPTPP